MEKIQEWYNSWIAVFGPNPYLKALLIILIFTVVASVFKFVVIRFLKRLTAKTSFEGDDQIVAILQQPLFVSLFIVGLTQAARVLELPDHLLHIVLSILKTITVYVWAVFAIKFSKFLLYQLSTDAHRTRIIQKSTLPLFSNLAMIIIVLVAVYFLFIAWGIDVSAWLASAGIIGIGLSLAAKDTLANLFAGIFILADTPYKLGDFIVLDTGERGQVTHIGIRSTRLLTRDDVEITVPNSVMGNAKITNEAGGPDVKHRIRLQVGVAYGCDVDKVREVLYQVAQDNPQVCEVPEPRVRFRSFDNSSLGFELLCWIDLPVLRGQVLDKLYTSVYKRFMELDIEIPYSKQDVYIKSMPPA